jgi:hypothetical protein
MLREHGRAHSIAGGSKPSSKLVVEVRKGCGIYKGCVQGRTRTHIVQMGGDFASCKRHCIQWSLEEMVGVCGALPRDRGELCGGFEGIMRASRGWPTRQCGHDLLFLKVVCIHQENSDHSMATCFEGLQVECAKIACLVSPGTYVYRIAAGRMFTEAPPGFIMKSAWKMFVEEYMELQTSFINFTNPGFHKQI